MNRRRNVAWLKKNKEVVTLVAVVVLFLVLMGIGLKWQQNNTLMPPEEELVRESVKIKIDFDQSKLADTEGRKLAQTTAFFLKPSPAEVLAEIEKLGSEELPIPQEKFDGLRVLWPAYFFSIQKELPGSVLVVLDVDEDGFGVVIMTHVDPAKFPQIKEIERGTKLWIAGEILAVEPTGTGTIYLRTEYVSFQEEMPDAPPLPEAQ